MLYDLWSVTGPPWLSFSSCSNMSDPCLFLFLTSFQDLVVVEFHCSLLLGHWSWRTYASLVQVKAVYVKNLPKYVTQDQLKKLFRDNHFCHWGQKYHGIRNHEQPKRVCLLKNGWPCSMWCCDIQFVQIIWVTDFGLTTGN